MSTTALAAEQAVGEIALAARCIEAAVHRPNSWTLTVNNESYPVSVEHRITDDVVQVVFVAGPMPEGEFYVELRLDNQPLVCASVRFRFGQWWKHVIDARLSR